MFGSSVSSPLDVTHWLRRTHVSSFNIGRGSIVATRCRQGPWHMQVSVEVRGDFMYILLETTGQSQPVACRMHFERFLPKTPEVTLWQAQNPCFVHIRWQTLQLPARSAGGIPGRTGKIAQSAGMLFVRTGENHAKTFGCNESARKRLIAKGFPAIVACFYP